MEQFLLQYIPLSLVILYRLKLSLQSYYFSYVSETNPTKRVFSLRPGHIQEGQVGTTQKKRKKL